MTAITGIGYIGQHSYGMLNMTVHCDCGHIREIYQYMKDSAILTGLIKNFGRFDYESKKVCLAVGLALHDSGISHGKPTNDIGIVASNRDGALCANRDYFKNYIEFGRTLGRGNLFVYTLPTSPLAEAAICYQLNGPLLYTSRENNCFSLALEQADSIVKGNEACAMLAVVGNRKESVCFVVEKTRDRDPSQTSSVKKLMELLDADGSSLCGKIDRIGICVF